MFSDSERRAWDFEDCVDDVVVEGIEQNLFDDGDWMCAPQTDLVANSEVDRGEKYFHNTPLPFLLL